VYALKKISSVSMYVIIIIIHACNDDGCTLCRREGISTGVADDFFRELQKQAFDNAHELLEEVAAAAQRLWTSQKRML
jgi:hypothetical protein